MIGVVYIGRMIDGVDAVLRDHRTRLRRQRVDTPHVIHMFGIVMHIVAKNAVITHAIDRSCPAPAYADARVGYLAHFVVFDMDIPDITGADADASPVFVGTVGYQIAGDPFGMAYFAGVSRVIG